MKKLNVAIALSKHLTLISLHVYVLTQAVKNGNTQAVAQLLKSIAIDRFSPLHEATVLGAALHNLVNNEKKDHARLIANMVLDRGIMYRGVCEKHMCYYVPLLVRQNDTCVALKMCHDQISDKSKINIFAHLVWEAAHPVVSAQYNLWTDALKGHRTVTSVRCQHLNGGTFFPTLLEWCLMRAPEHIVHNLIDDFKCLSTEQSTTLLKRKYVSVDLLDALASKGVNFERLLQIAGGANGALVAQIQNYQQRTTIKCAIDNTTQTSAIQQRKM